MFSSIRRLLVGALVIAALASAAVTLDSGAAGAAAAKCTAWGTLPAHVSLAAKPVTVTMTLTGSSACMSQGTDNGASAILQGPSGQQGAPQRWTRFGTAQQQTFRISLDKTGTYTLHDGDVQVYDSRSVRVPSTWRRTSTVIKHSAAFTHLTRARSSITSDLRSYTTQGWAAQSGDAVVLQERTGNSWKSIVQEDSARSGAVTFSVASGRSYRLVSAASKYTWGATSQSV